jgi:hypothetical protein
MEEHLPLALVEEEAQGGISTEGGGEEGEGKSGEEPASADVDWFRGSACRRFGHSLACGCSTANRLVRITGDSESPADF